MATTLELWTNLTALRRGDASAFVDRALMLEADGWDGASIPDSQGINVESYVVLTACAIATQRMRFGTGVTNPSSRHPSITAAAMLTLNGLSKGRAVLGIGRGDASLAYIGGAPVSLKAFEDGLDMIRTYMRGDAVPLELAATALARNSGAIGDGLAMHHAPEGRLKWVTEENVPPPVEVFCTGPKVIGIAARQADYITLCLGADIDRLRWAMGIAREELEKAGRDPAAISFGAHIPTFLHEDIAVSRSLGEGYIAANARFGVMNKKPVGPVNDAHLATLDRLANGYDMQNHGMTGSAQAKLMDDAFVDNFGLTGKSAKAVERLQEIASLGIGRLQLITSQADNDQGYESYRMVADEVVPALRNA